MTATPINTPKFRAFTNAGAPLAGGKLYSYAAGTTTPKATYTDYTATVANTNPVILDANGEANIWLDGNYKIVLNNSADVLQWSVDNLSSLTSQISYAGGTVTGTADALIVASVTPTNFSLITNASVMIVPVVDNTGIAATINVASSGVKSIKLATVGGLVDPYASTLKTGIPALLVYNGTYWVVTASITNLPPFFDTTILLKNAADATKQARFSAAGITAGTTRDYALPDANGTMALTATTVASVKKQAFTGNGTYTPSTGMIYCITELVGGGGGGGGSIAADATSAGGGGGAGGYSRRILTAADIGASKAVTIGAAGAAGAVDGTGGTGGTTSLGSLLQATGGTGGNAAASGGGAAGTGGVGSVGDLNVTGGTGGIGSTTDAFGGTGGASYFGGGGLGGNSAAGQAGVAYGSGGGGGGAASNVGGAGAAGYLFITEFCNV